MTQPLLIYSQDSDGDNDHDDRNAPLTKISFEYDERGNLISHVDKYLFPESNETLNSTTLSMIYGANDELLTEVETIDPDGNRPE